MKLSYSGRSDIGLVREVNQDRCSHVHCKWGDLFVVADGLGHREGGQFASQTTVDLFKKRFSDKDPGRIPDFFREILDEVNGIVYKAKIHEYGEAMMGSTCVALVIQRDGGYVSHVGDSRAYCLRDGELIQLTKDHSLVQSMVDEGLISAEQARSHPTKNIVTKALGAQDNLDVDVTQDPIALSAGERFLICSDGLWGLVPHDNLVEVLSTQEPEAATKKLIDLAKDFGGHDNITVQIIRVDET